MSKVEYLNRIIVAFYCSSLILRYFEVTCVHYNPQERKSLNPNPFDAHWCAYQARYNKTYTDAEYLKRRWTWQKNYELIQRHNALAITGCLTYDLRDNFLADRDTYEYLSEMTRLVQSYRCPAADGQFVGAISPTETKIADRFDWREKGFESGEEHQRNCASCYAHSIARSVQGHLFKKLNQTINLSVQQLVDCSTQTGNYGCKGGSLKNTLKYLHASRGLMREDSYPYRAEEGRCQFQYNKRAVNISSWSIIPANDEHMMQAIVAQLGPVAASLNASPKTFQLYNSGVYDDPKCTSSVVNHAVLIVGYTPSYWIVKNWWGSDWGENGYMRIAKMKNMCGIANFAAYAKV